MQRYALQFVIIFEGALGDFRNGMPLDGIVNGNAFAPAVISRHDQFAVLVVGIGYKSIFDAFLQKSISVDFEIVQADAGKYHERREQKAEKHTDPDGISGPSDARVEFFGMLRADGGSGALRLQRRNVFCGDAALDGGIEIPSVPRAFQIGFKIDAVLRYFYFGKQKIAASRNVIVIRIPSSVSPRRLHHFKSRYFFPFS